MHMDRQKIGNNPFIVQYKLLVLIKVIRAKMYQDQNYLYFFRINYILIHNELQNALKYILD
jgi:hypothetical protein